MYPEYQLQQITTSENIQQNTVFSVSLKHRVEIHNVTHVTTDNNDQGYFNLFTSAIDPVQ